MKKTVAFLSCMAMIGSMCVPMTSSAEEKNLEGSLSILGWYSDEVAEGWIDHFNSLYPDVKVEYQYAEAVQPYMEKLQAMIMSGSAPDLILSVAENKIDLIEGGMIDDLTDTDVVKMMSESCKTQVRFNDKIYAVTTGGSIGGMLVNMDLWEQAGLGEDPQTWDELIEDMHALEKLEGITPFVNSMDAATAIETPLYGATWMYADPDYEKKIASGEKTYADYWTPIFQTVKEDLYDSGLMTPELMGKPADSVVSDFALGEIGIIMGASWNFQTINEINPDLNYKVMGIPNKEGTCKYYLGDCLEPSFAVMSASENKENAMAFLESLFDEESLRTTEETIGLIACVDGYDTIFADNKVCKDALVEGMQAGRQFMPQSYWQKDIERMRSTYVSNIQALIMGEKTPEECAADFDAIYQK